MRNDYGAFMDSYSGWIYTQILEQGQAIMTTMEIAAAGIYNICWQSTFYPLKRESARRGLNMRFEEIRYIPNFPVRLHDHVNIIWTTLK
jgi:hypothetical protein